jgi:cinnamoyl-CoA reductase
MDPNRSPDAVLDETCWSDYAFCERTDNLYCCAKMVAEATAAEECARRGLQLAVVVPCMTMGPMLQHTLNFSSTHVARYLMGAKRTYPNAVAAYVDVRDVARAHVLVYERPAARGRYLCIGTVLHRAQFVGLLKELFPQYPVTARCEDDGAKPMAKPYKFSSQRIKDLGLEFTPLKKSLYEAVVCMQQKGHLPVIAQQHQRAYLEHKSETPDHDTQDGLQCVFFSLFFSFFISTMNHSDLHHQKNTCNSPSYCDE